jgi:hypothetical protein
LNVLIIHDETGAVERTEEIGDSQICVHVTPAPSGWSDDEVVAWLGQGLLVDGAEVDEWLTISWRPAAGCEICSY